MAALPSPTQVAGTHSAIYEAYYHQVDPNGAGTIQALDAARFLKKSRLSDVVLSKIWDLSDPTGKGYLDKAGLFVALKLVALAQAGKDINMSNIHSEAPPPKVGELPKVPPMSAPPGRPAAPSPAPLLPLSDWSMKPAERDKYSQLFDSLQPNNGLIAGNKVKGMLMESKLPIETLGKIWDLADQDKDGMLDRHEFMVAMHLVYKALEKHAVPTTLPPELRGPGGRPAAPAPLAAPSRPPRARPPRHAAAAPRPQPPPQQPQSNASLLEGLLDLSSPPTQTAPPMPAMPSISPSPLSSSLLNSTPAPVSSGTWVVTDAEKAAFDAQFAAADTDRDGYVSGNEIKHMFLDSGLPQQTLAHIWALCDMEGVGKLSRGQFALAMWLVQRALRGVPPPPQLSRDMLPPPDEKPTEPALSLGPQPTPEMEAIAREVDALARERLALEAELAAKQRDLTVKTGEADSLQSELDTLTATLKQLENQKGEAQKRLNDLKSQVEKLRSQVSAQEAAAAETEAEVAGRRAAAQTLREKERALQADVADAEAEAEAVTAQLRRTVLAVSQANIKISHLEEQHRLISAAAETLAAPGVAPGDVLTLQPQYSAEHLERLVRGATPNDALVCTPRHILTEEQLRLISAAAETLAAPGVAPGDVLTLQPQYSAEHLERLVRGATPNDALVCTPRHILTEEQLRLISAAAETLAAPGVAPGDVLTLQPQYSAEHLEPAPTHQRSSRDAGSAGVAPGDVLTLQPQYSAEHLERLVRGATPNDALEDEPFAKSNGFASGGGFESEPFAAFPTSTQPHDPFAPNHNALPQQDGFGSDPFASSADPFAGDAFTAHDNTAEVNDDDPFAVLHAPSRRTPTPALPPKRHKTPPPRPAPPRPNPPGKTDPAPAMDFADDPFKDYRYEDPFNIEDPFADQTDSRRLDPFGAARPTSVAGFETDDFFAAGAPLNGSAAPPSRPSGRVSAPPLATDPFAARADFKPKPSAPANNNDTWAAWPNDNWAADDAWAQPAQATRSADAWASSKKNTNTTAASDWKTDNWANKTDDWATDWGATDANKNLNETWPTTNTLPSKKEKSPRPVKYAKSLVHTIGGIGRTKQKEKKQKNVVSEGALPTEEQQWAWAAAESRRLQAEAEARRRQEDHELQLALALSRQDN
ncbi:LOW QUALITY PROTEIN: epidermal growth factor receptor substrate 15-like 1 [Helicoverpa armigera]|uniref:LOW QUALITY PROTEIN: epidermal growth factor receptor substrate 15-like 1 n=1 Tax=Helicoverpa armigera TaxID=29058 RepID=UPI003083D6EF